MQTRPIPNAPGYAATDAGTIINIRNGRQLKPWLAGYGYPYVQLGAAGPKGGVHRFVTLAFHGPPPTPKHEAAHINGDRLDNRPENLRWATRKENEADKVAHGTNNRARWPGSSHPRAQLTDDDVAEIRTRPQPTKILAARFGVTPSTIRRIVRGDAWKVETR